MKIIQIREHDGELLQKVRKLWRTHSATLGFFPRGAFQEYSLKGGILAAESKAGEIVGYLLYRRASRGAGLPTAIIVHLCVASNYRLKGVSKALVENLYSKAESDFLRVEVKCRKDYDADRIWPRLGFTYVDEGIGRAGLPLVRWQKSFREPPLLHLLEEQDKSKRFRIVVDANVFYQFQDPIPTESNHQRRLVEEARALNEEWIAEDVQVLITDEMLNEIHRNQDPAERKRRIAFARRYQRPARDSEKERRVQQRLQQLFPARTEDSPVSDIKQLSQTIAGGIDCFITQDRPLLKRAPLLKTEFGLSILSPGEFVCRVDEIAREVQYQPASLAGTHRLNRSRMRSVEMPSLYGRFVTTGEKRGEFDGRIRAYMAQRNKYKCEVWRDGERDNIALIVTEPMKDAEMVVHVLRTAHSPFANTIARYLLRRLVLSSIEEGCFVTRIADAHFSDSAAEAFEEFGFAKVNGQWVKLNFTFIGESRELLQNFDRIREKLDWGHPATVLLDRIAEGVALNAPDCLIDIERRLWPAKIMDAPLQNYVVSIRPSWAQHLFDPTIARETLWGAKEEVALRNENVYYRRRAMARGIMGPARVLWYVTEQDGFSNCKQVRACSFLDEIVVGPAKSLFGRFRRLGIYEWRDVLETADNKPRQHVMALKFSNTEDMLNPIGYQTLVEILLHESGKKPVLQSPQPISARSFERLYSYGRGIGVTT